MNELDRLIELAKEIPQDERNPRFRNNWANILWALRAALPALEKLREERQSLPDKLQNAYAEGFSDGADHNNLDYKYPPLALAWLQSDTRRTHVEREFGIPLPMGSVGLIDDFYAAKYSEIDQFKSLPLEDLSRPLPEKAEEPQ